MRAARQRSEKVRITLRLPKPLYEQARTIVEKGWTTAETINDFFIAAIQTHTKMLRKKQIDAAFRQMPEDARYQKEAEVISGEFAESDWESLHLGVEAERESHVAR